MNTLQATGFKTNALCEIKDLQHKQVQAIFSAKAHKSKEVFRMLFGFGFEVFVSHLEAFSTLVT